MLFRHLARYISGLEISLQKGTAKMRKLAIGLCYFEGHLLTTAISKRLMATGIGAVSYFLYHLTL